MPVVVGEGDWRGMTLGGVGEGYEDVPRRGDGEEDCQAGYWVKLTEALEGSAEASG